MQSEASTLHNNYIVAECLCLSMRYIILRGRKVPTIEYAVCIYLFTQIYDAVNDIVYRINLFTMPGMQRVVYAKSLKVLCLLLIAMNRIDEATLN